MTLLSSPPPPSSASAPPARKVAGVIAYSALIWAVTAFIFLLVFHDPRWVWPVSLISGAGALIGILLVFLPDERE